MIGTVILNIVGIASNSCELASAKLIPPIIIAKIPAIKPAMIISTFLKSKTSTNTNGISTRNALTPVGATISLIASAANTVLSEKIKRMRAINSETNVPFFFITFLLTYMNLHIINVVLLWGVADWFFRWFFSGVSHLLSSKKGTKQKEPAFSTFFATFFFLYYNSCC